MSKSNHIPQIYIILTYLSMIKVIGENGTPALSGIGGSSMDYMELFKLSTVILLCYFFLLYFFQLLYSLCVDFKYELPRLFENSIDSVVLYVNSILII